MKDSYTELQSHIEQHTKSIKDSYCSIPGIDSSIDTEIKFGPLLLVPANKIDSELASDLLQLMNVSKPDTTNGSVFDINMPLGANGKDAGTPDLD